MTSAETPSLAATSAWPLGSCGKNSCSGGSSVRMVTGMPFIALKRPSKSARWKGSSFASAFLRSAVVLARIISRIGSM